MAPFSPYFPLLQLKMIARAWNWGEEGHLLWLLVAHQKLGNFWWISSMKKVCNSCGQQIYMYNLPCNNNSMKIFHKLWIEAFSLSNSNARCFHGKMPQLAQCTLTPPVLLSVMICG